MSRTVNLRVAILPKIIKIPNPTYPDRTSWTSRTRRRWNGSARNCARGCRENLTDEVVTAGRARGKDGVRPSTLLRTWDASHGRRRLGCGVVAARVRRPRGDGARAAGLRRGDHQGAGTDSAERHRTQQHRAGHHGLRHGRPEAASCCPAWCVPTTSGVRACPNRKPVRIWRRCARAQCADGDDFVVNGQKIWTSLGDRADWCQLYVRTDPDAPKHAGISCLIVDMTLPGIEVRPLVNLNGNADFAEVFFNDVRVPAASLLGPLNGGWQVATTTLSHERAGAARLYAGLAVAADRPRRRPGRPHRRRTSRARGRRDAAPTRRTRRAGRLPRTALQAVDLGRSARRRRARARQRWPRACGPRSVRRWPNFAFDVLGARAGR